MLCLKTSILGVDPPISVYWSFPCRVVLVRPKPGLSQELFYIMETSVSRADTLTYAIAIFLPFRYTVSRFPAPVPKVWLLRSPFDLRPLFYRALSARSDQFSLPFLLSSFLFSFPYPPGLSLAVFVLLPTLYY